MISATALLFSSRRTFDMLARHDSEDILGVQVTGKTADETARAVEILGKMNFETIDINMGCPVAKVVNAGCGSAILREPNRVFETVRLASQATDKPLSVKIRIGWDHDSVNALEIADAVEKAGGAWLTVHGRTRSDDYSAPVDLEMIARVKQQLSIPVYGNGNIFSYEDAQHMQALTGVDGVMVSRGALGDPWLFARLKGHKTPPSLDEWMAGVCAHLRWQEEEYGSSGRGIICMRKHLLWYLKGWPGVKSFKDDLTHVETMAGALAILDTIYRNLQTAGITHRAANIQDATSDQRFRWDPKWDMDRRLDRGVGDDGLAQAQPS
jgi:nifR3 family TIM-barrel protein